VCRLPGDLAGGDPTPLSFAAAVVGFAWMIRNDSLFKVVPLARRLLFSELPDPVLVLDPQGRVMDANAAASKLAGTPPDGELREQALRDPLTGLRNRRALDESFRREATAQAATARPLALVLLDLDHFKRINDSAGHATGDAVLREMAALMQLSLRAGDSVFRVGGEEFALLLPGADRTQAALRLNTLRETLATQPLPSAPSPVTFSAGVAEFGRDGGSLDALLREADRALYRAKAAGRNRCEFGAIGSGEGRGH